MLPLSAQAPAEWNQQTPLGGEMPSPGMWYGAGLWGGDHHGPAPALTNSLGLGNALSGGGFHLEGGYRGGSWDMAVEVLGNRDPSGHAYLTVYRSHLWRRSDRGWQVGFEQEPLVWGYGLNGGYLLGEAARPFPRLRVESPMAALHLFRVPLGDWGWQAFMGRMENHPEISPELQNPSQARQLIAKNGLPEAPFLMGYRVQAKFGPLIEFYLNTVNFWGGTLNGKAMTDGYRPIDYATAMLGIKDGLTEAGSDFSDPNTPAPTKNATQAVSATEINVGLRVQVPSFAKWLGAEKVHLYISRGSKSAYWPIAVTVKRPLYYTGKDVSTDLNGLLLKPNWGLWWNQVSRYTVPTLNQPNDTVGILVAWPQVRAGLEYFACSDVLPGDGRGFRPFTHSIYATGFYYYGDPLGSALGGESITTTAKVEVDFSSRLSGTLALTRGFRPFRDYLPEWQLDHPGASTAKNRFTTLQQTLAWKARANTTLKLTAAWQHENAVSNVAGRSGNGFAWFSDLIFRF